MIRIFQIVGLVAVASMVGCGPAAPKTVPGSGVVLMDGKPLEGASVNLYSDDGTVASGKSDAAGKFTLKTTIGVNTYDGVKVGKHKVAIAKTTNAGAKEDGEEPKDSKEMATRMGGSMTGSVKQTFIVPAKYNTPTRSGLECDVPEGGTDKLSFDIKSK
jgi:hypothetical protein